MGTNIDYYFFLPSTSVFLFPTFSPFCFFLTSLKLPFLLCLQVGSAVKRLLSNHSTMLHGVVEHVLDDWCTTSSSYRPIAHFEGCFGLLPPAALTQWPLSFPIHTTMTAYKIITWNVKGLNSPRKRKQVLNIPNTGK